MASILESYFNREFDKFNFEIYGANFPLGNLSYMYNTFSFFPSLYGQNIRFTFFSFWCKFRGLNLSSRFSASWWIWTKAEIYKIYTLFPSNELETQSRHVIFTLIPCGNILLFSMLKSVYWKKKKTNFILHVHLNYSLFVIYW